MRFAAVLLLLVYGVHYGTGLLSSFYADPAAAERALFYVGQGLTVMCCLVIIAAMAKRSCASIPLWAVCGWGIAENFMVVGCRLAKGIQNTVVLGDWQGVCEVVTETPLYTGALIIFSIIATSAVGYGASRGTTGSRPYQ